MNTIKRRKKRKIQWVLSKCVSSTAKMEFVCTFLIFSKLLRLSFLKESFFIPSNLQIALIENSLNHRF